MSLANGRSYLAIPGPSVVPDEVLRAMHRASPNIYEGELVDMTAGLIVDLRSVARTKHNVAIYMGNGHAAWEAALSNVITEGDLVLVPSTGRFCHGWGEMATGLGAEVEVMEFGLKTPMDASAIEARLRADKDQKIKAVLAVHVDTSTSIKNNIADVRAALDAAGHPALLMVDCIASLGCDRFEMDAWGVDVMVTASQKGLMVTPGLGFVFFNDRAVRVRANMERVSLYWDWVPRAAPEVFFQYFGGTAPTHMLYGLRAALDIIQDEGIEAVWARHETLASAVWAACEAWGQGGPLTMNVAEPAHRSHAVTALRLGAPHGTDLRRWSEHKAGVTLGIGLGMSEPNDPLGDGFIRIGHMGHVNTHMVLGTLASIQAGFDALKLPYGAGALDAAAKCVSGV
ncbi:pyridoxal-phosphate-dependent aminotransferase family protein [Planktotalea sp.]|uniref:pyridoxal-phosphate-dependent aminotransferase family protein n=1 Tax=Planktotalea sp. TaxID=2029877 RepID=UPI003D6B2BF2